LDVDDGYGWLCSGRTLEAAMSDFLGVFEASAKAGKAYVCAIRQAYRDALKPSGNPESDYYATRLGRAEEEQEVQEPAPECECWWVDEKLWTTHYGAAEPGSQMEWNPDCPVHPPADPRCNCTSFGDPLFDAQYCTIHTLAAPAGDVVPTPNPHLLDLEAAHEEGYDRGRADADRIKSGLSPNVYNPYSDKLNTPPAAPRTLVDVHTQRWTQDLPAGDPPSPAGISSSLLNWIEPAFLEVLAVHHAALREDRFIYCETEMGLDHARFEDWQEWREHCWNDLRDRLERAGGVGATPTPNPAGQPAL
jgi:hypothetical protein